MSYNLEKDVVDSNDSRNSVSDLEDCPLTGDENHLPLKEQRRKFNFRWPADRSPFWKFWSIAMTIITLILVAVGSHKTSVHDVSLCSASDMKTPTEETYNSGDAVVESWKKENLVETHYYRDLRYMTLNHDSDWLWKEHLDMLSGNIILPAAEDGSTNATLKSISMFHQMHCLAKMRMTLQRAREGEDIGEDWKDDAHWPHCFDYLRSSIMCYADGTLESVSRQPGPVDDGTFVEVIDGGEELRYCRDTKPIYELVRHYGPSSRYGYASKETDFEVAPGK
ncbi:uncharacterized protein LY89DRAFT_757131 [Mollisia scopiformis]|uniref:Uncharacterized protein n=1 Tax=Mollisia scopiformis TaxID=149040 RepID=A0A194WYA5_MOLSC|nr:uncharacterized protein LY89DRAFT_757131 [Mollisia scopiformis]KUJ12587.1 hypothetical protein LY89DRAFT_757131 [Mollisia scopiformis]